MAAPISKADLDAVAERHAGSARPDLVAMATDLMSKWGVVEGTGVDPRGVDLDDVVVRTWYDDEPRIAARTGALGRFDVAPGEQWRASFDGLGDVAIRAG
jgi:hypothetical protein